jgi:hypothetical protein
VTGAVHTTDASWMVAPNYIASDSPYYSYSGWWKVPTSQVSPARTEASTFFDFDPANTECPELSPQNNGSTTLSVTASNLHQVTWAISGYAPGTGPIVVPDEWVFYGISIDCNQAVGQKRLQICIGDTVVVNRVTTSDNSSGPISMIFSGLSLAIPDTPDDDTPITADMADAVFMPGTLLDWTDVATRRKFISASGKPVDLSTAIADYAPSSVHHIGVGEDPANYALDRSGTGNNATITGTFTAAPSSPSD